MYIPRLVLYYKWYLFATAYISLLFLPLTLPTAGAAQELPPQAIVEEVCQLCHRTSELEGGKEPCSRWMKHGHPVYVTPSDKVQIPAKFPLNNGQLYCGTCHTSISSQAEGEKNPILYSDKVFLRFENNNSSLCRECHPKMKADDGAPNSAAYNHPINQKNERIPKAILEAGGSLGTSKNMIICETCHTAHNANGDKLLVVNNENSDLCGLCHPEMQAYDRKMASTRGTHPVNILPSLAPVVPSILEKGGELGAQGKMVCLTCHKVHQAPVKKSLLIEENEQSSFCIKCHASEGLDVAGTKHDLRKSAPEEENLLGQKPQQSGPCGSCHLAHKGSGAKIWAKQIESEESNVISQLCESCHWEAGCASLRLTGDFSHPVGVSILQVDVSRSRVPLFNSLGERIGKGEVTCASCHNVHRWAPHSADKGDLKRRGDGTNSFLRVKNIKSSLCKDCHSDKLRIVGTEHDPSANLFEQFPLLKDAQGEPRGLCAQCHLTHNAKSVMLWRRDLGEGEDEISRICASCHSDGQVAEAKQVGAVSHPIGRSILELGPLFRRHKIDLPLLDDAGQPDHRGKVYCNTCHNTHQWDPNWNQAGNYKKIEGDAANSFLRRSAASKGKDELCSTCHLDKQWIAGTDHDLRATAPREMNAQQKTAAQAGVCGSCHAVHNGLDAFALWNKKLGAGDDPISQRCNGCHSEGKCGQGKQIGHSHPVGVYQLASDRQNSRRDKPELPVYDENLQKASEGKVFCSTCHDSHQWAPGRQESGPGNNREGDNSSSFLRLSNQQGRSLCLNCHQDKLMIEGTPHDLALSAPGEKNQGGKSASELGVCDNCHAVHQAAYPFKLWVRKLGQGQGIISKLCNSCHTKGECAQKKIIGPNSHPVDVKMYGAAGPTTLPLYQLDGQKDRNGLVACASCHNPHQWDPGSNAKASAQLADGTPSNSFLRIANYPQPQLCQNCHQDKMAISNTPHDLALSAPAEKNALEQTPAQSGLCRACHLTHNSAFPSMLLARKPGPTAVKSWGGQSGKKLNPLASFCTSCHFPRGIAGKKLPKLALHPENLYIIQKEAQSKGEPLIPPPVVITDLHGRKIRISAASIDEGFLPRFPLFDPEGAVSWRGDITCPTCHDSHQINTSAQAPEDDPLKQGQIANNFLRPGIVGNLCSNCHGYQAYFLYTYYHRSRAKVSQASNSVHWSKDECLACHENQPQEGEKSKLKFEGDITKLCTSCHNAEKANLAIHPVNLASEDKEPKLPLHEGQIDCLTCHDLGRHQTPSGNFRLANPSFLRFGRTAASLASPAGFRGKSKRAFPAYQSSLCFECHQDEAYQRFNPHQQQLDERKQINKQVCLLCHNSLFSKPGQTQNKYNLRGKLSEYCIGCHPRQTKLHPANSDHYGKKFKPITFNTLRIFMRGAINSIPMDEERLVCPSCHNPHQAGVPMGLFGAKKSRRDVRERFVSYGNCSICHRGVGGAPTSGAPF